MPKVRIPFAVGPLLSPALGCGCEPWLMPDWRGAQNHAPRLEAWIMTIPYFVLTPDQREAPLNVVGTQVTVLASNAATQSYGITFQQGNEGAGPPPHSPTRLKSSRKAKADMYSH